MDTVFLEMVLIAVLVVVNGFFSCSEFAIISIRKSRIAHLVASGDERAKIVEDLQKDPQRVLALVQIGVTVVGSAASAIGGLIAGEYLKPVLESSQFEMVRDGAEPISLFIVVAVISYLSLIIGELVPKALGLAYADKIALVIARPINLMTKWGSVAVSILTASSKAVLAVLRVKAEARPFITREEVQHIVAEGHETGAVSAVESEYIKNIFDFTHTSVREVMVPRTRMVALDLEQPREEMLGYVLDNMYSRYPVYRETIENIAGFVHSKDLLGRMVDDPGFDINTIIRPPYYVPEGKRLNDLLKEMQRKRIHMALVVDEYGGLSGLVTTEDLLEELVGEIEDEHDIGEPRRVQRLPDGSLSVDALISISDLEDILEIDLGEEDLPYDTLAGLILDRLGRFPEKGETLEWSGFLLRCEEVTPTAIVKVRISRNEPEQGD
ncbi:hemolysin family protein [Geobacter sp. DSM 9736]|uniref:hemolysin family protein n=1 Tax=Geobacter sp. DSM 9736 TaxID=1277350 RepID=UPI000B510B76|nr:hemolysin family protein [Geobacter sp. DSM 9736]SNB45927.1 putative hemolysin [Geobacter sp. DSM 9736]